VLDSCARSLVDAGFEVGQASAGVEALRRVAAESFDVVLTDSSLPEMDGLTLVRTLRARGFDVPVILMLSEPDAETAIRALEGGALHYLVKPIDAKALREAAESAVRRHRSRLGVLSELRNRRGDPIQASSFTATEAKNEFGRVLETVIQGGIVVITKHEAPKAVLVGVEEFRDLARARTSRLDTLRGEFDALLARMQTPEARSGMKAAFDATPVQLGEAAVAAAHEGE
jgi:prevent-host-death family protein